MFAAKALHVLPFVIGAGLIIAPFGRTGAAQTPDPFLGNWKLNVAKSKYSPGPAPKSGTVVITASGKDGVKVVVEGVSSTDAKVRWEYTANHDGKDYPVISNPDADTISLKRVDARTVETSNKKAGKPTLTNVRTVAADGKTMTVTTKGTNAAGQTVNNTQVFEKS